MCAWCVCVCVTDLYLKTNKTQTSIPLEGFEPAILANERPQTHVLKRAATGVGAWCVYTGIYYLESCDLFVF